MHIAPIDIDRDVATCIAFRRDMYVASFGTARGLDEEMGERNASYIASLREKMAQVPEGNSHLWEGARILGQTEVRLLPEAPDVGYVSLLYLAPEARGRGLVRPLHEHVVDVFRARGMRVLRLSVSQANPRAIAAYRKLGWAPRGWREHPVHRMDIMEYDLTAGRLRVLDEH